jgi:hypothetical protein
MVKALQKYSLISLIFFFAGSVTAHADHLKVYVIKPRIPIDWSSPSNLSVTSGLDSAVGNDYAPIGHFAVEVSCTNFNRYGARRVLTGMERKNKKESSRIVMKNGLGLSSLTYSFVGALQPASEVIKDVNQAQKDGRLQIIEVPTSAARCDSMMQFIENWIDSGSYTIYGGGKQTSLGEGAGCADFAMELFQIATESKVEPKWLAHVKIPKSLMKTSEKKISFLRLLTRFRWADADEASVDFQIPDTDLVTNWLKKNMKTCAGRYLWTRHVLSESQSELSCAEQTVLARTQVLSLPSRPLAAFQFRYETEASQEQIWAQIAK